MRSASDLKFGTSGLRGLASILAGKPAFTYTYAFVLMLLKRGDVAEGDVCMIGRDLRASSPEIAGICAAAIAEAGLKPVDCGDLPTPALALAAQAMGAPAVMVTGSHIPADRNGLKFYTPKGEIDKADEAEIVAFEARVGQGLYAERDNAPLETFDAMAGYIARYHDFFGPDGLAGLRIGVWQHSSVGRDVICDVVRALGATVTPLGRSEVFVPIDTEAVSGDDRDQAAAWVAMHDLDALVSTDGDADRPLVFDETGAFVEGELLGAITAELLGADIVVTPLTSNSGLEACGRFGSVRRCRVGSPFVIAEMQQAREQGGTVVGFEANGGVLLGSDVERGGRKLAALPTRDSLLPILSCLETVAGKKLGLSAVSAGFAFKAKAADRLENVPPRAGSAFVAGLAEGRPGIDAIAAKRGGVASVDGRDGTRMNFADGSVLHFRMSGNAPELRCYAEAQTKAEAERLVETGLAFAGAAIFRSEVA